MEAFLNCPGGDPFLSPIIVHRSLSDLASSGPCWPRIEEKADLEIGDGCLLVQCSGDCGCQTVLVPSSPCSPRAYLWAVVSSEGRWQPLGAPALMSAGPSPSMAHELALGRPQSLEGRDFLWLPGCLLLSLRRTWLAQDWPRSCASFLLEDLMVWEPPGLLDLSVPDGGQGHLTRQR